MGHYVVLQKKLRILLFYDINTHHKWINKLFLEDK